MLLVLVDSGGVELQLKEEVRSSTELWEAE